MSVGPADCIFCRIAKGEIPATVVGGNEHAVAFRDLAPKAPTHVLVIPRRHIASTAEATGPEDQALLGEVLALAIATAADLGLATGGYRLVLNTGPDGGQTVGHLHVHLLGGRPMGWPPG